MGSRRDAFCFGKGGVCAMEYDPYTALANAIIEQAVEDYRKSKNHQARSMIKKFFLPEWYSVLTEVDGKMILRRFEGERGVNHVKNYRKNS